MIPLRPSQVFTSCAFLARVQQPDGMVPWAPGLHADPWNHVEAAMALTVGGFVDEAVAAYRWLATAQHADGSWCTYYLPSAAGGIEDAKRDTNVCAYVAAGALHHLRATGDRAVALQQMWPMVERAMGFVLRHQRPDGSLTWSVQPDGSSGPAGPLGRSALLTGSASAYHSLRCAVALAEHLGMERPEWELAAGRLATAVAFRDEVFEPKSAWAMDWYYPVLCGAVGGDAGRARLRAGWDRFVTDGLGVRCIDDHPWYTGAETAECATAHALVGLHAEADALLQWTARLRQPDGGYWTGVVEPSGQTFPHRERSTYTAAAIVLADDCLHGRGPASGIFRGEGLPAGLDLDLAALAEAELDRD